MAKTLIWHPDFCPSPQGCILEVEKDWSAGVPMRLCPHHEAVQKNLGLTDDELFRAIVQSSRVKEVARWTLKVELAMPKDEPPLPYTVESDGNFTIDTGKAGAELDTLKASVDVAVGSVEKPTGTSTVTIR